MTTMNTHQHRTRPNSQNRKQGKHDNLNMPLTRAQTMYAQPEICRRTKH